jgi:hypothetical protein
LWNEYGQETHVPVPRAERTTRSITAHAYQREKKGFRAVVTIANATEGRKGSLINPLQKTQS